jgi:protein disulfide-isomerase A1
MEPSLRTLSSIADLKSFIDSETVVIVGFIKDSSTEARKVLEETANNFDKHPFGVVSLPEAFTEYGIKSDVQISLFKNFDERRDDFDGELKQAELIDFIQRESIPLIVDFSQESAEEVFGSSIRKHVVAFFSKSEEYQEHKKDMESVAKTFKGKVHFIVINATLEDHQRIMDFFGMSKADVPGYRLVSLAEEMTKFQPDSSDFSVAAMSKFIDEVLTGTRKPFLMSQEIPPESSEPLRIIVGKNYNDVVKDKSKTVVVMLHAPWCGHCKQLSPTWDELAKAYKDSSDVVVAKMDATANEAEGLQVHSFPTIKLYPKDSDEVIDYSGERTLDALKKFIDSDGKDAGKKEEGEEKEKRDEL